MTHQQRLCLTGLLGGSFLVSLDSTIVATAAPRIVADLGGEAWYSWIAGGYLLGSAVIMPLAGRAVDLVNGRLLLMASTALFILASGLCSLAESMEALIAWRVLQGLGGGAMMAVTMGLVGLLYAPTERGPVMAAYAGVLAVASVAGPLLGGLLADHLGWRRVFDVNIPLGLVSLGFLLRGMPDLTPEGRGRLDLPGSGLLVAWSVPLLLALSGGRGEGPGGGLPDAGLLAIAAPSLALFLYVQRRTPDGLFDLGLFGNRVFTLGGLGQACAGGAYISALFYLPLCLVQVQGVSATQAGLALTPVLLGLMVGSTLAGRLTGTLRRTRPLLLAGGGLALPSLLAAGAALTEGASYPALAALMLPLGAAFGVLLTSYPIAVQNAVERARMGTATSTVQFMRTLGQSAALALTGTLMTGNTGEALISGIRDVFSLCLALAGASLAASAGMPDLRLKGADEAAPAPLTGDSPGLG